MSDTRSFVIVGAGQAGRWLALTLRSTGFDGRIVWFGDEAHTPYERPPLSKAVLKDDLPFEKLVLLPAPKLGELRTDWRPSQAVVAIDRQTRCVVTSAGERVAFDTLFLANGGSARTLPGLATHPRVATLRTFEDARSLKALLLDSRHVLVLGGGWIGLEVAASARQLGCEVTLLEAAPRLCQRTVPPCVSKHLRQVHEAHGVTLRLGEAVQSVAPLEHEVGVTLASGERITGDCLVVGIGLIPNDRLAADAGLATDNGVLTDALGRTNDAAIFAVGDLANVLRADGSRLRLESWQNAERMAIAAAKTALGVAHDPDTDGPPWFWSDQYDDNLQLLGLPDEHMQVIERVVPEKRQRVFFFCEGARVRAVATINAGREIRVVRKWLAADQFPELGALADPAADLNRLPVASPDASE